MLSTVSLPMSGVLRDRIIAALRRLNPGATRTHIALYDAQANSATGAQVTCEARPLADLGPFVCTAAVLVDKGSGLATTDNVAAELFANGVRYGEGPVRARTLLGGVPDSISEMSYPEWAAPVIVQPGEALGVRVQNETQDFSGNKLVVRFEGFHVSADEARYIERVFGELWVGGISLAVTAASTEDEKDVPVAQPVHVKSFARDSVDVVNDGAVQALTILVGALNVTPATLKHTAALPLRLIDDAGRLDVLVRPGEKITGKLQAAATRAVQLAFIGSTHYARA